MSDEGNTSKAAVDGGQQLKRTHYTSFGTAGEDHANDTNDSSWQGKNSSPEGWMVKVSIGYETLTPL